MRTLTAWAVLIGCGGDSSTPKPEVVVLGQVAGQEANEWTGYSLGAAGDINGDGRPDILTVGLSASTGGRVGVFFGPLTGNVLSTQADIVLGGERGFENLGESVIEAGGCDIDADGFDDLLLASPFADRTNQGNITTSGDNAGRVYVFYGGASLSRVVSATTADETFVGEAPYDVAGKTVACLGDVDADGHDDFAIGAPRAGADHAGQVYLIYGGARGSYGTAPIGLENADTIFAGTVRHQLVGASVLRASDLDGDGHEELAIGAPNTPASAGGRAGGAVYILRGTGDRWPARVTLDRATIHGDPGTRLGHSIARAGDFDGDGRSDLLIGGSPVLAAASAPGAAYLYRGRDQIDPEIEASSLIRFRGERAGDAAGISITSLGDVDRDGFADIAIGAVRGDGDAPGGGRVYFVRGRAITQDTYDLAGETVVLGGTTPVDYLGEVIRNGGDVDGDGDDDLLVSARGAGHEETSAAGKIYIISGKGLGGR